MDKSWMKADRTTREFQLGVEELIKFACDKSYGAEKISCPCLKCVHTKSWKRQTIKGHLFQYGINQSYTCWIWHGEANPEESPQVSVSIDESFLPRNIGQDVDDGEDMSFEKSDFIEYVRSENEPLYPGCKTNTKLKALVKLYNLKAKHGISDSCFTELLLLIGSMLPDGNCMPSTFGEAKKNLCALGLEYEKIHACPNDCLLYRGERDEDETTCRVCGTSRWKLSKKGKELEGVPAKVLFYFPLLPRLRNMFNKPRIAKDMTWHDTERPKDGKIRHPANSKTWKDVDNRWPEFALETRNLRLALSTDGFNPFRGVSTDYSCWPVLISIYNLPPSICMKRKYIMLSLLISRPNQPGNNIDVYLQMVIEDLQMMWRGKEVYDAYRKEFFTLRAILLWTVSDYPALGNLSGNVVKGYNGCVVCLEHTKAIRLSNYRKTVVMRHRRWLPRHHPHRRQKSAFDNTMEKSLAPIPLTGEEVFQRVQSLSDHVYGKTQRQPRLHKGDIRPIWKKVTIFFQLEYWKFLPVRHVLDVMHIEKNICEALIGTLLNIPGKTKDRESVRIDMVEMGIKTDLRPKFPRKKEKLPMASWNLLHKEKKILCSSLLGMKLPEGFCSNIKSLVSMENLRLVGLKSHDFHTLLHHLLPIAIRSVLQKEVKCTIIRFCLFFKAICSKVIDSDKLEKLQTQLVETMCSLEKYFPPSFFDVMVHLSNHLVREVELCGPVWLRWMYPFERDMKTFKGYVRNQTYPEGCIAEAYVAEEAIECLVNYEDSTIGLPNIRRDKNRPLSGAIMKTPSNNDLHVAHLCFLQNYNDVQPYFQEHMTSLMRIFPQHENDEEWLKNKQNDAFPSWFRKKIASELESENNRMTPELMWIAEGPNRDVPTFSGYRINGVTYSTKDRDERRQVQCNGVCLEAQTMLVLGKEKNIEHSTHTFYGVITDIWELDYNHFRVPIFRCNWVDMNKGIKLDDMGYTLVNLSRLGWLNDPFVLGKHVKQVCYIDDPLENFWSVVLKLPEKYNHGLEDEENDGSVELELENDLDVTMFPPINEINEDISTSSYMREEDEMILLAWVSVMLRSITSTGDI